MLMVLVPLLAVVAVAVAIRVVLAGTTVVVHGEHFIRLMSGDAYLLPDLG